LAKLLKERWIAKLLTDRWLSCREINGEVVDRWMAKL
jgi:hypothetical protein